MNTRLMLVNGVVAALYACSSLLSLYLTVPQSSGPVIYPSAAIAFVAILKGGTKLLPGVWVGAFIASFWNLYLEPAQNNLALLAFLLSIGACLQAIFSAFIVVRVAKIDWRNLTKKREIILFALLSGPLGCLVSATWSCVVLHIFNIITVESFHTHWLYWWIADTMGVAILAPILLILLFLKRQPWRARVSHVAFPILMSLLVTFTFFLYSLHSETRQIQSLLQHSGESITSQLNTKIGVYEEAISSVSNFIKTYPNASYADFNKFTQTTLESHSELQALSWNPRVANENRAQFEARMAKEINNSNFKIIEKDSSGAFVTSAQKNWYVPIAYISPFQSNKKALGFDVSSNSSRLATLNTAIQTRQPAMTPPINLVQDSIANKGVLLILPLFENDSNFTRGFAVGVIRISNIMQTLLYNTINEGLDVVINDMDAPNDNKQIFSSLDIENISPNPNDWSTSIELGGRTWELTLIPSNAYINANQSFLAWQVLLIGVLLTSLLQMFLLFISGRHYTDNEKLQLSASVFEHAHEGIMLIDTDGDIIDVNPTFTEITGFSKEEVVGQSTSILSSDRHDEAFHEARWEQLSALGHWQGEVWNRKKTGELYVELLTISSITDEQGRHSCYVGLFSDITLHKEQQTALELMAHYDTLTGLPNRVLFADRSKQAFAHSKRSKTLLAICFLDIDHFKQINDTFGHQIGDLLITEVAHRIQSSIREENTVSRLGGDEFTLLLSDLSSTEECERAVNRLLEELAVPYLIDGYSLNITASCGIAVYPTDNADLDTLVRHADQAMYKAKLAGRNQSQFFDLTSDMQTTQKHLQLLEIQEALNQQQFCLYYQPKVNMKTGKVYGFEALIRWYHPQQGLVYPLDFLPIIEGTELELLVGNWVISEALQQLQQWLKAGYTFEVSVNISSYHLQSPTFIEHLRHALASHPDVNAKNLQLEILESSALGDLTKVSQTLQTCQQMLGVQIALDDFGTGYSSLTHLRNLRSQIIKIDQSFVRDILDDPNDYAIIDGVIGLTNSFSQEAIAEGVETTDHGIMLLSMGCINAQGYGIAKPMPAHEVLGWLNKYTPNPEWIAFANQDHDLKETRLIQLQLVTQRWFTLFEQAIHSTSNTTSQRWPLMSAKNCHHSALFNRSRQDGVLNEEEIEYLESLHLGMHQLARSAFNHHQEGEFQQAASLLDDIQKVYEELIHSLKSN